MKKLYETHSMPQTADNVAAEFNISRADQDAFALRSQQRWAAAHAAGRDIGAPEPLARYQRTHRLATRPLYEATRLVATLYTADAPPARLLRDAVLRVAERVTPFKRAVAAQLAGRP